MLHLTELLYSAILSGLAPIITLLLLVNRIQLLGLITKVTLDFIITGLISLMHKSTL